MNFVSIVTIFVTLLGVARPGEIEGVKPDVEHALPILVEPDPNNEPTHGTCYNNLALACPAMAMFADPINVCSDCVCMNDEYTCCRRKAEPKVRCPEHCRLTQDQDTCEFLFSASARGACEIVGWYYSEVGDTFDNVPDTGLPYDS
ncbi:hypothetical protein BSL78_20170 [Apostichopus japonicus]|uniref:Uncharacterized protein n=1 Tax=Stichopus japonicus TaxID=307972 RepID=A0A2G8K4X2_STIJA|nr:hypothetical protein BSL78_20170 [Apostichopus japonicus]